MASPEGMWHLLRSNPGYRRLWMGDIASLLGDWFNTLALFTLVSQLTGSPLALGLVFITKTLPYALASPWAGWLVDRLDRRRLMIAADLLRAATVLGFLAIDRPSEVPLLYALAALQMTLSAVFMPARTALIPSLVAPRQLLTANALSSVTWSILLTVGAALGGLAVQGLGVRGVFWVDSATYLFSAFQIFRLPATGRGKEKGGMGNPSPRRPWAEILAGWQHLRSRPALARIASAKAAWALGGSGLIFFLTQLGQEWMPAAPAVGMGLLFGARGLGTGLGPLVARQWVPQEERWPRLMGWCMAGSGIAYLLVGGLPWAVWMVCLVVLAHAFSGANWVTSTVMLQQQTEDRFRGRVFATEGLLFTLVDAGMILLASLALGGGWLTLPSAISAFAGLQLVTGILWLVFQVPAEEAS